ncbi:hypothetical protein SOHN41_03580 [Shewanella sp. HN-41]|nr:hypothetical protein SOHN41_03580 [Shewanella sp. HN-41]
MFFHGLDAIYNQRSPAVTMSVASQSSNKITLNPDGPMG